MRQNSVREPSCPGGSDSVAHVGWAKIESSPRGRYILQERTYQRFMALGCERKEKFNMTHVLCLKLNQTCPYLWEGKMSVYFSRGDKNSI